MAKETKRNTASHQSDIKKAAKAGAKFLRIAPRKIRLVIDVIRHKPTDEAFRKLMVLKSKSARLVEKVLKTAVANAKVLGMDESRLCVSEVRADGGPSMKRFMARSMGRADRILKRMTHLSMVIREADRQVNQSTDVVEKENQIEGKKSSKEKTTKRVSKKAASAKA